VKYFWSAFFIAWPVVAVVACLASPATGMWFPPQDLNTPGSTFVSANPLGRDIDGLFYLILWITGLVFVGTQVALAWVLYRGASHRQDKPAAFVHGNTRLEVLWTVIPGAVLLFIAFDQLDVWANFRVVEAFPERALQRPLAEIEARQFSWQIRYAAPGQALSPDPRPGDLYDNDRLYVPVGEPVLIWLRTRDVQHSFFIPQFRIKQDALPGQVIPVWFQADEPGEYPFLCAELCGWGHYKMGGSLIAQEPAKHAATMEELARSNYDDGVADQ
jgi:cytochrome c oxidase subunit II